MKILRLCTVMFIFAHQLAAVNGNEKDQTLPPSPDPMQLNASNTDTQRDVPQKSNLLQQLEGIATDANSTPVAPNELTIARDEALDGNIEFKEIKMPALLETAELAVSVQTSSTPLPNLSPESGQTSTPTLTPSIELAASIDKKRRRDDRCITYEPAKRAKTKGEILRENFQQKQHVIEMFRDAHSFDNFLMNYSSKDLKPFIKEIAEEGHYLMFMYSLSGLTSKLDISRKETPLSAALKRIKSVNKDAHNDIAQFAITNENYKKQVGFTIEDIEASFRSNVPLITTQLLLTTISDELFFKALQENLLHNAVMKNSVDLVKTLMKLLNEKTYNRTENGRRELLKQIFTNQYTRSQSDKETQYEGLTPLGIAIVNNSSALVDLLIGFYTVEDLEEPLCKDKNCFELAAERKNPFIVESVFRHYDVQQPYSTGGTTLKTLTNKEKESINLLQTYLKEAYPLQSVLSCQIQWGIVNKLAIPCCFTQAFYLYLRNVLQQNKNNDRTIDISYRFDELLTLNKVDPFDDSSKKSLAVMIIENLNNNDAIVKNMLQKIICYFGEQQATSLFTNTQNGNNLLWNIVQHPNLKETYTFVYNLFEAWNIHYDKGTLLRSAIFNRFPLELLNTLMSETTVNEISGNEDLLTHVILSNNTRLDQTYKNALITQVLGFYDPIESNYFKNKVTESQTLLQLFIKKNALQEVKCMLQKFENLRDTYSQDCLTLDKANKKYTPFINDIKQAIMQQKIHKSGFDKPALIRFLCRPYPNITDNNIQPWALLVHEEAVEYLLEQEYNRSQSLPPLNTANVAHIKAIKGMTQFIVKTAKAIAKDDNQLKLFKSKLNGGFLSSMANWLYTLDPALDKLLKFAQKAGQSVVDEVNKQLA